AVGQSEPVGGERGVVDAAPDLDGACLVDRDPRRLPAAGVAALPAPHDRLTAHRRRSAQRPSGARRMRRATALPGTTTSSQTTTSASAIKPAPNTSWSAAPSRHLETMDVAAAELRAQLMAACRREEQRWPGGGAAKVRRQ